MVNPVDGNDRDIATSYDLLGRVTQVDDGAGKKVSFTYDALGRKLSESPQLTGGSTSYQYDPAGRRTRLTWSDGFYVSYDYDTLGELLAIRENGATSGVGVLASFAYDDQGRATGLTRGNGVNDSFSYDAASRLSGLTIAHPSAGTSYSYAYNPANQLISRSMSNDAYAWTQAAYVNRNYTVNGLNQYTASGSVVPSYDGRGNMTSAGSTAYAYDSKNKLTTFGTNALGYDAMGRLATQATPATRFVYDGTDLIAETDASNNILRRYVHIPGTDNVLVWYEGSGTSSRRWLAHDERGSTTLITDASGTSLGINAYDEYGIPQSTNLGRFQYTGQTWLPELGMYYYKARIYSPTMGRFMQTDPIGYGDGPNWYNYVHGDPINGTDATGQADITPYDSEDSFLDFMRHGSIAAMFDLANKGIASYLDGISNEVVVTGTRLGPQVPDFTSDWAMAQIAPGYGAAMGNTAAPNGVGAAGTPTPAIPPSNLPGGPYTAKPSTPGNRPGSFQGPKPPSGPRTQAQWVPPEADGGPPGSKGYWKVQIPGEKGWSRYNEDGDPLTAEQAHPNPPQLPAPDPSKSIFLRFNPIGIILCGLFCAAPAY
jgi:RHS repeat-associated protein